MQVEELFHQALELPPQERDAFLDSACGDNADLRARVAGLLHAHANPGSFLQAPAGAAYSPTVSDVPMTESPGTVIGPYRLLEQIGEGGFGVVFMAEQTSPVKRKVALKVIKPGMDTREVIARFDAERQALALMDHPNIAKVLDAGATETGRPFFVMELVRGVPITEYCDQAQLTPRQRLELFVTVCQAVQHAHQKGVIHRDIKPTNVLVAQHDDKPVVKVIDFGVAKATSGQLTDKTLFTAFAQVVGTPLYMSPEQAALSAVDIDTRSDIYSLGVLLYELLTGTTPFDKTRLQAAAFEEVRRIIREEEPQKPSTRLSSLGATLPSVSAVRRTEPRKLSQLVRGDLDWIVMKALEKDRARRYDSANGFASDVLRYLADEPVTACPPSAVYRFRKFTRRNKVAMATTGMVVAALSLGLIAALCQTVRATRAERLALANAAQARNAADAERRAREAEAVQRKLAEEAAESERQARADEAEQRLQAEAAEKKANQEAAVAKAVRDFLQEDLLGLAGAEAQIAGDMEPDPNLRLMTLLERALARVDERFADQPEVRAEVQETLAGAFDSVGRYDETVLLRQEVREYREAVLGPEHPKTLDAISNLAVAYDATGQTSDAIRLNTQTLELRRRLLGPEHPPTLVSMNNLSVCYARAGRHGEALTLMEQVFESMRMTIGAEHPETIIAMVNLMTAYLYAARPDKAALIAQQALDASQRIHGPVHPVTLGIMANMREVYQVFGLFDRLVSSQEEAFEVRRRVLGSEHPDTLISMLSLAEAYRDRGRYADAEPLLREYMAISENQTVRGVFQAMSLLGECLMARGDFVAAEPLLVDGYEGLAAHAEETSRTNIFYHNRNLGIAVLRLCALYEARSQPDEAARWREKLPFDESRLAQYRVTAQVSPPEPRQDRLSQLCSTVFWLLLLSQRNEASQSFQQLLDEFGDTTEPREASAIAWCGAFVPDLAVNYERVLSLATTAVDANSKDRQSQLVLGAVMYRAGRNREALDRLMQLDRGPNDIAVRAEPLTVCVWYLLGLLHEQLGQRTQAWEYFTRAQYHSEKIQPHEWRIALALLQQEAAAAIRPETIDPDTKDAFAWRQSGVTFLEQGKPEDAIAAFREAIKLVPHSTQLHTELGEALAKQKEFEEAIMCFRQAVELDANNVTARVQLGLALREQGSMKETVECFRATVRLAPDDAAVHVYLGQVLRDQGALQEAIDCFYRAIECDPNYANAYINLGVAQIRQGCLDDAAASLRTGIELSPRHVYAHIRLAGVLQQKGEYADAIEYYRTAISLAPHNAEAQNNLAWILATCPDERFRDPAGAIEAAGHAVDSVPSKGDYWCTLGAARCCAGDWHGAIEALEKSTELQSSGKRSGWFFLAMAHQRLGESDQARMWYDRAAAWMDQNSPGNEELRRFRAEAARILDLAGSSPSADSSAASEKSRDVISGDTGQ